MKGPASQKFAGVDEVGRGPLAGPVVAACVVLPGNFIHDDFRDSKQLSPQRREQTVALIKKYAIAYSIVAVGHHRIEKLNIREASRLAMALAVQRAARRSPIDIVLVDGNVPIETDLPQRTIVGGDRSEVSISAASILAKVYRDRLMKELDLIYPGYEFSRHAGYPTEFHREKIAELGPCPIHRVAFKGVKEYMVSRHAFHETAWTHR